MVWNLLSNAAKYTEPGAIRVSARREGAEVVLRVRDSGIGIEARDASEVFGMFAQVDQRAAQGLGIELCLVKTLVEMHGGTIEAHSRGSGHGQRVRDAAARLAGCGRASGRAEAGRPGGGRGSPPRRRILVVDDNVDAATSLARPLSRLMGQEVRVAHDGPTALEVAESFRPELVLLDIGMPGMDGHEVARRLQGRPSSRRR